MEIKDYKFEITNIKISIKLPQEVSLGFVEDRCRSLQSTSKNIYCSRKKGNLLTVRYNNFTYILFKRSSKVPPKGSAPSQHCNITKLKSDSDIAKAIEYLFFLVDQSPTFLNYSIDNYSCLVNTYQSIDISALYLNERRILCKFNEEGFPAVIIYCPQELKKESKNLTCLVYRSGKAVLVGGKNLPEIEEFLAWVIKIVQRYTT
jgi:TATA-box binding protein (TBP) (component of TFIID and TFIIIB)